MRSKKGFTLIELMIVIVIIGILAWQMVPQFSGFDNDARVVTTKGNLSTLRTTINMYRARTGKYPKSLANLLTETYFDAGAKKTYLKKMPLELMSSKTGSNDIEVLTSDQTLTGNGGWTYQKDIAEVVVDYNIILAEEWDGNAGQDPSKW